MNNPNRKSKPRPGNASARRDGPKAANSPAPAPPAALVEMGENRIAWAAASMPVLLSIRAGWRARRARPLSGLRVSACLHVTTETANLVLTLKEGGAAVRLCASNPLSTQDDVVAALNAAGVATFARRGVSDKEYYDHIRQALDHGDGGPAVVMDDGADLIATLHRERTDLLAGVRAGTEETTTGVTRLTAMGKDGALRFPVIAVNNALTKHMFDNRYGTGQSTVDAVMRSTNRLIAGSTFVVAGYGWCGRGIALRARGLGARVIVVEVDPLRALEAVMDGYEVTDMDDAAPRGDFFVTATGDINVIVATHFACMKDGAILANAGHFNVEVDVAGLAAMARERRAVRDNVEEFVIPAGGRAGARTRRGAGGGEGATKRLYLLAEGRLVNLAAAEGHPASVMDMSFANQALVVEWLVTARPELAPVVHAVPAEIDRKVAALKLAAMGVKLEKLTAEQKRYLTGWESGTK